jgi:hypothetical protein
MSEPFFKCEGKSNKIAVIIRLKDGDHQICEDCWNKLAEINWSTSPEVIVTLYYTHIHDEKSPKENFNKGVPYFLC